VLYDLNLTIPKTPTKEERDLDKTLQEKAAQSQAKVSDQFIPLSPPRSTAAPVSSRPAEEKKNWITAAMLDDALAEKETPEEDNWLINEQAKQTKRQSQSDYLMQENQQQQPQSPLSQTIELNPLKQYQLNGSSYLSPVQPTLPPPSLSTVPSSWNNSVQTQPKPAGTPLAPLFSPKLNSVSSIAPNPLKSPSAGSPSVSGPSSGQTPAAPAPLSPLQQIKKSSPIHQADPFSDNHVPQFKSSIWE
jgi:hypothetical protein